MVPFLIALALCYVLVKIPFWVLGSLRGGGGRSFVGGLVRGFLAYKTLGLLRGGSSGATPAGSARSRGGAGAGPRAEADPYARVRADSDGQYMLPLGGLKHGRLPKPPHQRYAPRRGQRSSTGRSGAVLGWQPALLTRSGEPARRALPPSGHPGAMRSRTEPGQQSMLPIIARHDPDRAGRVTVHDERAAASETYPVSPAQDALFTSSGRISSRARPEKAVPPPTRTRPGEQFPLPLRDRWPAEYAPPTSPSRAAREPEARAKPHGEVQGQRSLFHPSGKPTKGALPRERDQRPATQDTPGRKGRKGDR